jgi:hypothetical protein
MRGRSVVAGVLGAVAMLLAAQVSASANVAWCVSDPPVQVVTPGGHNLTINNQVYLPPYAMHLKSSIHDTAFATRDSSGGTLVTVNVFVPDRAHVVSSENRWQVSDARDGSSVVTLYLHVPIS